MSARRKHLTLALKQDVRPPAAGEAVVRALGARGGNIVEVRPAAPAALLEALAHQRQPRCAAKRGCARGRSSGQPLHAAARGALRACRDAPGK